MSDVQSATALSQLDRLSDFSDSLFRTVMDSCYESIVITDANLDDPMILYVNPAFCRMTGYDMEELLGRSPKMLQGERTDRKVTSALKTALQAGESYEAHAVNYRKDGSPFYMQWRTCPVVDENGSVTHYMALQRDVTDEVKLLQRMKRKAEMDYLTRLLTRGAGEEDMNQMLVRAKEEYQDVSCIVLDIDHFKSVNDQHGHLTGDRVLRRVAHIIDGRTRGNDLAIRWGGEEFVCALWSTGPEGAIYVAESIRNAVQAETIDNLDDITISCGVAQWDTTESTLELVGRADKKLYEAKEAGRNRTKS